MSIQAHRVGNAMSGYIYVFEMAPDHTSDAGLVRLLAMHELMASKGSVWMPLSEFESLPTPKPPHALVLRVASGDATFDYVHDESHIHMGTPPGATLSEVMRGLAIELARHGL